MERQDEPLYVPMWLAAKTPAGVWLQFTARVRVRPDGTLEVANQTLTESAPGDELVPAPVEPLESPERPRGARARGKAK